MIRSVLLGLVGLVLLAPWPAIRAADKKAGTNDLKIEAELTPADPMDKVKKQAHAKIFDYKMEADKTYQIDMKSPNPRALDPFLRLEDPAGQEVAKDDDSGGDLNARIVFTAQKPGTYKIICTSFNNGQTGKFILTAQEARGFKTEVLTAADPMDRVRTQCRARTFDHQMEAGKTYQIDMKGPNPKVMDPYLRLEDSSGKQVAEDDDGGGGLNAKIVYTAEKGGKYKIVATTCSPGQLGKFILSVKEIILTPTEVVFCKKRRGEVGTYLANTEGRDQKRIMFLAGAGVAPRFSPNCKSILFSIVKGGQATIWTANRNGEERKEICRGDQATWSADGSAIFFRRAGQIVRRLLASQEEKIISPPEWKSCAFPDCSPNGQSILFVARVKDQPILFVATPGTQPKPLADLDVLSPARWSPEGNRIAYSDGAHIFIMAADGSWKYRLTSGGGVERFPAWSADGTALVFCLAPTANAGWGLCFAKADGTVTSVLPGEDGLVSCYAPDWRSSLVKPNPKAAIMRPAPRVTVGDVSILPVSSLNKFTKFFKERGIVQIVKNQRLILMPSLRTGSIFLWADPFKMEVPIELVPVSATGDEAQTCESLKITNSDESANISMTSTTKKGEKIKTLWRMRGSFPAVQVWSEEKGASLRMRAPLKYVVIPDRFANDLVFDPAQHSGTRITLPAAPLVLGLAGGEDTMLTLACPRDGQTTTLLKTSSSPSPLAGEGRGGGANSPEQNPPPGGRDNRENVTFAGAEVRLAKTPVTIGLLTGPRLWHETHPNAKFEQKRLDLQWEIPGPASWRLAVRAGGRTYATMLTEQENDRFDGKRLVLTGQEDITGLVDLALMYLYDRSPATSLDQWTPLDVALDGMGFSSFMRSLDIEGLQSYRTAPRPTTWTTIFDSIVSIRTVYERGVEFQEKEFVQHLCDDVPVYLDGIDGRLDAFVAFAGQVQTQGKSAEGLLAALKPALDKLDDACNKHSKLMPRTEVVAYAMQIKELTATEFKDPAERRKKYSGLGDKLYEAARQRTDLIRAFRKAAKELRDQAGLACAEHPDWCGPVSRLRQLAQEVLRDRYYFEGDWRGEPHQVAPFWLGSRPY